MSGTDVERLKADAERYADELLARVWPDAAVAVARSVVLELVALAWLEGHKSELDELRSRL